MSTQLNDDAIIKLLKEDIIWLLKQPRDLERDHIEIILLKEIEYLIPIDYNKDQP